MNKYIKLNNIRQGDKSDVIYNLLPQGRPNYVNRIVSVMQKSVSIQKQSIKQMHTQRSYTKEAQQLLQQLQVNALNPLPTMSKATWTRAYIKSCGAEKIKCSDSYAGRAQAIMDWRNAIGCAATWFACLNLRSRVKPCNIWSGDDVAVTINPTSQKLQVVRITKEERDKLNKFHMTPGAMPTDKTETEASNVVCKMFNLVNAEGTRGPITAKLLDNDFKWKDKPDQFMAFYCVNSIMQLYVVCVNKSHPKYCEIEYFEQMMIKIIIPYVIQHRSIKCRSGQAVLQMHSQESMSPNRVADTGTIRDQQHTDDDRIVITMDGYYPGIEAIIRNVGEVMNAQGIEAFKWAGGCSLKEQPADVADNHKELHKAAAGDTFKYDENGAPTEGMDNFIKFLASLGTNGARLHTHQKFLRHFEWMVDKAWTKHGITEGWRISGMWPVCAQNILSGWGGWEHIPTENAQKIVSLCTDVDGDAFHEIVKDKFLDDLKAQAIFGHLIEDEDYKQYMTDKLPTATPSNHRCLMLTSKRFDDDCSYVQTQREQRRLEANRIFAARAAISNGVQLCVCGLKLPKDVSKHLSTSMHERRCRALGIWTDKTTLPDTPPPAIVSTPVSLPKIHRYTSRLVGIENPESCIENFNTLLDRETHDSIECE